MQGLGIDRGKGGARGMGWGQGYGLGIKGWGPWVRVRGQGLRRGVWGGVGPGLWGWAKDMGWGSFYFFIFSFF